MKKNKKLAPTRRDFIKVTAVAAGAVALGGLGAGTLNTRVAKAAPLSNYKRVVVFNLVGGNDGLNTVIPVSLPKYFTRRPSIHIPNGISLAMNGTTDYRMHPSLPKFKALWDAGDVAIIRNVGFPNENQSHFTASDIWSNGVRNTFGGLPIAPSGWLARFADLHAPTPTGIISVGAGRPLDFSGGNSRPLMLKTLADFKFDADSSFTNNHTHRLTRIQNVLNNSTFTGHQSHAAAAIKGAFDAKVQVDNARTSYTSPITYPGATNWGNLGGRFKDIAALIKGGFDTRVFYTMLDNFDTHSAQIGGSLTTGRHAELLSTWDDALDAFILDLKDMNVYNDTAIIIISEFGRRNYENGSSGTDHGFGNYVYVVGGRVNGGFYGPALTNNDLDDETWRYDIDFRTVYIDLFQQHMGIDLTPIFPETRPKLTSPGTFIS